MDQGQALFDALGEWNGFEVTGVERREGDPDEIHVSLKPREDVPLYCNCCGRTCDREITSNRLTHLCAESHITA